MRHVVTARHHKFEILQRRGLGDLPVNARRGQRLTRVVGLQGHVPQVELEVADLAEELVLVDVPLRSVPASQSWWLEGTT